MMGKSLVAAAALALALASGPATAMTYDISTGNLNGTGLSLSGTITTDGTIGSGLSGAIITAFNFDVTFDSVFAGNTQTFTIDSANGATIDVDIGGAITTTATSFAFDFGAATNSELEFQTSAFDVFEFCNGVNCLGDGVGTPADGVGIQRFDSTFNLIADDFLSAASLGADGGPLEIGSTSVIPVPATLPLLMTGVAAVAGLAAGRRRRGARASGKAAA